MSQAAPAPVPVLPRKPVGVQRLLARGSVGVTGVTDTRCESGLCLGRTQGWDVPRKSGLRPAKRGQFQSSARSEWSVRFFRAATGKRDRRHRSIVLLNELPPGLRLLPHAYLATPADPFQWFQRLPRSFPALPASLCLALICCKVVHPALADSGDAATWPGVPEHPVRPRLRKSPGTPAVLMCNARG